MITAFLVAAQAAIAGYMTRKALWYGGVFCAVVLTGVAAGYSLHRLLTADEMRAGQQARVVVETVTAATKAVQKADEDLTHHDVDELMCRRGWSTSCNTPVTTPHSLVTVPAPAVVATLQSKRPTLTNTASRTKASSELRQAQVRVTHLQPKTQAIPHPQAVAVVVVEPRRTWVPSWYRRSFEPKG